MKSQNNTLVSVIVPIYNVEEYIHRCVDSLLNQSYRFLQIILVDDGSTDNSPRICDEYADKDSRIDVIHKKNGGLSDARNVGLDIAKGELISFVDGDDWIDQDFIRHLVSIIKEKKADIAIGSIYHVSNGKTSILDKNKIHNKMVINRMQAMKYLASEGKITTCACDKLYRKYLLGKHPFPYGKLFEDKFIMHEIFHKTKRLAFCPEARYYYSIRSGSITNQKFNSKMMENIEGSNKRLRFYRRHYPQFEKHVRANRCYIAMGLYISSRHDRKGKPERKKLKRIVHQDIGCMLHESDYIFQQKWNMIFYYTLYLLGIYDIYKFIRR